MTDGRVDLAITGAHLWREESPRDLFVRDGRFVEAPAGGAAEAERTIDAGGRLCVAGFLEPHIHLDKAQINDDVRPNRSGTLDEAIEIIWARKRDYTVEEIAARAVRTIRAAAACGVTRFRSHVDVDSIGGLRPLEGVLESARAHPRHRRRADRGLPAGRHLQGRGHRRSDVAGDGGGRRSGGRHALQRGVAGGQPPATLRWLSRSRSTTTPTSTCTWTRPTIPTP